ncbi:MAG: hypothetical protein ACWGQW_23250 [bacterium]
MRRVTFTCVGTGQLLFGKQIFEGKGDDETHEQMEERTWLNRCNKDEKGHLALPSIAFCRSLVFAAKWLNMKIPGEGKKTYTKRFECGVVPDEAWFPLSNGKKTLKPEDAECLPLSVPSNGQRGGGKRVVRKFPRLSPGWTCKVSLLILDETITEAIFTKHIKTSGVYDGMGSMRVGNGNTNGRFVVEDLKFENVIS